MLKIDNWQEKGICYGLDPDLFFPRVNGGRRKDGKGSLDDVQSEVAKRFCFGMNCPVRIQCLNYAIDNFEDYGVWGGTTEKERVRIRRSRLKRQAS